MTPAARWAAHAAIDALLWRLPMQASVAYYAYVDSPRGRHHLELTRAARATGMTARERRLQPKP